MKKLPSFVYAVALFAACHKNAVIPNQTLVVTTSYSSPYHVIISSNVGSPNGGHNFATTVLDTSLNAGNIQKTIVSPAYYTLSVEVDYSDTAKIGPIVSIHDSGATAVDSIVTDNAGQVKKIFTTGGIDND